MGVGAGETAIRHARGRLRQTTKVADCVSRLTVSEVMHEKRPVTPDMTMRRDRLVGNGPAICWRTQQTLALWELEQRGSQEHIETLKAP